MIYLASPYTHKDAFILEQRYEQAMQVIARLSREGHVAYSPIVHFHVVAKHYKMPTDYKFWKFVNHAMIDRCIKLVVLRLPGWETSKGVTGEIEYASSRGIKIEYIDAEDE